MKETLQQEPASGHLFVFTNRQKNRLKILFWDGSGLCLFCKRLERGTYAWPTGQDASRALRPEELQLLIHGIDGQPRQRWYRSV